ncbi:MAG: helix-turn-helix domain-containing protein [Alloprevotella sp.]|nr:helix-turn-helix domain-containing protein [Alloprevotella sp.]
MEGISDRKAAAYWNTFGKAIAKAAKTFTFNKLSSPDITLFLFRRGNTPAEIALIRGFKTTTIYDHLSDHILDLKPEEIDTIIDPHAYADILAIMRKCPDQPMAPFRIPKKDEAPNPLASRYPLGLPAFACALATRRGDLL